MNDQNQVREGLLNYLENSHTHIPLVGAVKDFPERLINEKPAGVPYTFWAVLEHIRITQRDMIDFIKVEGYQELDWPKDYWPKPKQKADIRIWMHTIQEYENDLETLKNIIKDPKIDLYVPIPNSQGQTILREIFQIIDHAAYHLGEFVLMRRAMGVWKA